MTNYFKKSLLVAIACFALGNLQAATIYESDLVSPGTGYTVSGNGTYNTSAVSWASAYSNYWKTGSSTNKTTLTFSNAIDLSAYSNVQMTVYWGHTSSGKPIRIFVNNTEITAAANGSLTATAANTLYETTVNISETSITSITFQGKSSSGLHVFHFTITGDSGTGGGGGTDPNPGTGGGGTDPNPGTGGGDTDPNPGTGGGGTTPAQTGNAYAYWRFSGGDAPALNSSENGTNMTVEFLTSDNAKTFSNESVGYNAAVTDDEMKSQGNKAVKMGGNALYLKVTVTGGFKANDVIYICGYNPWKISTTSAHSGDVASSLTTGTSKSDYNIGTVTLTADASELYMMRGTASGTGICAIKVMRSGGATPTPTTVAVTGVTLNKTATTLTVGATETLTATVAPANATNKAVTWASDATSIASVDNNGKVTAVAAGTANITVTTTDGSKTATCAVTVNPAATTPVAVTGVSLNKTATTLTVGATETLTATVAPANATNKAVTWASDATSIASVDNNGKVTAVAAGTANITVTTTDGSKTATCVVTVNAAQVNPPTPSTPVPSTTLSLHTPGVYEDDFNGYGGDLVIYGNREYEVFYATRDANSKFIFATTSADKTIGVTTLGANDYSCTATDGWFKFSATGWSSSSDAMGNEFGTMARRLDMDSNCEFSMHIQGYDQFAIVARDKKKDTSSGQTKPADNKYLEVYIDDVLQPLQFDASPSIRRYDLSSQEHVIRIKHKGADKSAMYAFSLRLSQEPSVKWIRGNDSTQTIRATESLSASIQYKTKYNNIAGAKTELQWTSTPVASVVPPITFNKISAATGALIDTFAISGVANCPAGKYEYAVVSTFNGVETSRANGSFYVINDLRLTSDDSVLVYKDEEMDAITFRYYAYDPNDVQLTWLQGTPAGISGNGNDGKYLISGTPTQEGIYPFSIKVAGADTTFFGQIEVKDAVYGDNAVLYLYKNNYAYNKDGVYNYLKDTYKMVERKAKADGLRTTEQYSKYKWILISEDADANNQEVIQLIRDGSSLPVLNMKGFTYAKDSLRLGWGDPNNGAVDSAKTKKQGNYIILERSNHPIFKYISGRSDGNKVTILADYAKNGVMPIAINNMPGNTTCLATAPTRGEEYYSEGPLQTAIHEIPASQRGGSKYICLPIARQVSFTNDGKNLLKGIIEYLLSPAQATIEAPELRITKFTVNGIDAKIDEGAKTIKLEMTVDQFNKADSLKAAKPVITLADPVYSHVTPASNEEVNLQYSIFMGKTYEVTDYINRVVYEFKVQLVNPQGIEEVYETGQWVNIYDIFGRKVTTTNEDIYTMDLPHGMYIVVTESGNTLKIMR